MTTVGYGGICFENILDVTPKNDAEVITANLTMLFSCAVFAFSINSLGMIL